MSFYTPIRRWLRSSLSSTADKLISQPTLGPIALDSIRYAAIIRPNTRIGNTLFLLPLMNALAEARPGRWVDLMVGNKAMAQDLFRDHPVVRRIINVPKLKSGRLFEATAALRQMRDKEIDLIIDPTSNSTSSRMFMALCRPRYRLGFSSAGQWLKLSHPVPYPDQKTAAWRIPLALLEPFGAAVDTTGHQLMVLQTTAQEQAQGRQLLHDHLGDSGARDPNELIVGFICDARGKKLLDPAWWREWVLEFERHSAAKLVQIVSNPETAPIAAQMPTIHSASLRKLAALMTSLDLFVSCDTGPMHLAAAAGTPVSTLFSHTDPKVFGPGGPRDQILMLDQYSIPELVTRQIEQLANARQVTLS